MSLSVAEVADLKQNYQRDGFVIVRKFASRARLAEIRQRVDSVLEALAARSPPDTIAATPGKPQRFTNVTKGLERLDDWFKSYLRGGPHVAIIEALTDEPVTPATVGLFTKTALDEEVAPHNDGSNGATVWLALDPSDETNGCLHFLRGSHLADDGQGFRFTGSVADLERQPNAVAACLEPGDISIHDARTVHWSGKNASGRPRRGLNCFYQRFYRATLMAMKAKGKFATKS